MRVCEGPDCERVLVSRRIPVDQRPAGAYVHVSYGLCRRCYYRATRPPVVRPYRTRDEVLEDWVRCRQRRMSRREAARAMGMSFEAFTRAYERARAAGDPRAVVMA